MPAAHEEPTASRRLGDFEILRELGRGGMGVVYEARQASLNRKVALKVLSHGAGLTTPKAVQRFQREAEAAAKLHHTNIVPIYATGEHDGTHYYAMELIDGPSLDQVIRPLRHTSAPPTPSTAAEENAPLASTGPYVESPTPSGSGSGLSASSLNSGSAYFDTAARLIAEVADALDYAHQQGVIHRDIKPSNLLLSPSGRLSVNDFGLARLLEQPGMTVTGEFVGTPAYMSPEQITAGRIPVDHRTDIYSLGATLYELLTLQPPFRGASRDQLLAQIIQKEPPRPCRLNPKTPVDLETICLKCLEKDPDRRYRTAGELAEDLRRYVNRFAIMAKRPGPFTKFTKWVRRNPALSGTALVLLIAVGVAGYFAWQARENHLRHLAELKQRDEETRRQKQRAAIDRGMVAAMAANLAEARAAIAEAESLETSAGELHLLKGFVALYSVGASAAVKEFRAAADAMPKSVAARALLAVAHGQAGDWDAFEPVLKEAERLPIQTPEDRLFLGLALTYPDPPSGLREMRAALSERSSNIGHIVLADALWFRAQNSGKVSDAKEALVAAETVARMLPKNPYVEVIGAWAHVAAAITYDLAKQPDKAATHLDEAERLAANFSGPPDSAPVMGMRFWLAQYRDGVTPPLVRTKKLTFPVRIEEPDVGRIEALVLWRLGDIEKARARVLSLPPTYERDQLQVALALEAPDGRKAAKVAWDAVTKPGEASIQGALMIPWLYLTGEPERVPKIAGLVRRSGYRFSGMPVEDWDLLLRYWEGAVSDQELLDARTIWRGLVLWRYMIVGMKRLGEGDREGAKALFATAHGMTIVSGEWEWCTSFLIRMNSDPEWPRAISVKKR